MDAALTREPCDRIWDADRDRAAEPGACLVGHHHRLRHDRKTPADEGLTNEELIKEKYAGIRPAPGYPACPDHSIKEGLFELLGAAEIGMTVTESMAMLPAASVSGFYFSHPDSTYFNVGKISDDQVQDLAQRSGVSLPTLKRFLGPNL